MAVPPTDRPRLSNRLATTQTAPTLTASRQNALTDFAAVILCAAIPITMSTS